MGAVVVSIHQLSLASLKLPDNMVIEYQRQQKGRRRGWGEERGKVCVAFLQLNPQKSSDTLAFVKFTKIHQVQK